MSNDKAGSDDRAVAACSCSSSMVPECTGAGIFIVESFWLALDGAVEDSGAFPFTVVSVGTSPLLSSCTSIMSTSTSTSELFSRVDESLAAKSSFFCNGSGAASLLNLIQKS